ncbi:MAG: O-acetyl-ADP-ribose deacetylase [Luteolibacter sp.]
MNPSVVVGDITELDVDAIVNTANPSLLGGGGVDGAIHKTAGPGLLHECKSLNGCEVGKAKLTAGYNLPSRFVIHAVGPVWDDTNQASSDLRECYRSCFRLAALYKVRSISFPAISTGAYGFPKEPAAYIAVAETLRFLRLHPDIKILFCCFTEEDAEIYRKILNQPSP